MSNINRPTKQDGIRNDGETERNREALDLVSSDVETRITRREVSKVVIFASKVVMKAFSKPF